MRLRYETDVDQKASEFGFDVSRTQYINYANPFGETHRGQSFCVVRPTSPKFG